MSDVVPVLFSTAGQAVGEAAFGFATGWLGESKAKAAVSGAYAAAASKTIEAYLAREPTGTSGWVELTSLLGTPEAAARAMSDFKTGGLFADSNNPVVSDAVQPYFESFVRELSTSLLTMVSGGQRPAAEALSIAIAGLAVQVRTGFERIQQAERSQDPLRAFAWHSRPGAPVVDFRPSAETDRNTGEVKLGGVVTIRGEPLPATFEVEWSGAGITAGSPRMMPENDRIERGVKFQLKAVRARPSTAAMVTVLIRFVWHDGEHGYRWEWPLRQHEKGHWLLDSHLGSGLTGAPF